MVDFSGFIESLASFANNNTLIAIVIALGLLIFLFRKPKLFFVLLFLGLLPAGSYYMVMNIAGSSSEQKKKFLHEEEKQSDSIR